MSATTGGGSTPQIKLLSSWFCPYAQRAWIALEERCAGSFTVVESMNRTSRTPPVFEKTALLLQKNPKACVPVIVDGRGDDAEAVVVYESLICVEYVDEAMGNEKDVGPRLLPGPPSQRAHARMWADRLNSEICTPFYRLLQMQDQEGREEAAEKILRGLLAFSTHCQGPFFYGEQFSIVDITIAPWTVGVRMDVLKHYRNFEVPRTGDYGKYWEWVAAVSNRASFRATVSHDLAAMIDIYLPYAEGKSLTFVVQGDP